MGYGYPGNNQHPSVYNVNNAQNPVNDNQFNNNQFYPMHMNSQLRQFLLYQQQQQQQQQHHHNQLNHPYQPHQHPQPQPPQDQAPVCFSPL
jgi:hypothetical protein